MKYFLISLLAGLMLLQTACRVVGDNSQPSETTAPATQPAVTEPATAPPPTAGHPTRAATPILSTETPAIVTPETDSGDAGQSTITPVFPIAPFDPTPYEAGLVRSSQDDLERLPDAPVYHVAVTIDDSLAQVTGRQTVYITNQEGMDLDEVYFHLHPNLLDGSITVSDVFVDGIPVAAEPVEGGTALRMPLGQSLQPGKLAIIDMAFETTIPTDIGRNYGVLAYYEDTLALAHFYPMLAVYDDEGWNITPADVQGDITYSDPAFYLVEVIAPKEITLVAGGKEISREGSDASQTVRYATGPARDFFLAAHPDYMVISRTIGETTINSYAPRDLQEGAELALAVASDALTGFSQWLGDYPYTELDIVTTPTSALGIEYPGIIVGTQNMYDPKATTNGGTPMATILESTTAHEVGHQWFYSLVGNDQLDEPWLDEALVTYITYRYFQDQYGRQGGEAYYSSLEGRWDRVNREEIPIGLPVADYEGPEYGAIVYGRGAIFMRVLEETMGRATFDAFLRDYVDRNRWSIATADSFRALAEEHCECDLSGLWSEWVDR